MSGVFSAMIQKLEAQQKCFSEPKSFKEYLQENNFGSKNTASHISIQKITDLKPELREYGYMVFRLGSRLGDSNSHTHFALAKLQDRHNLSEYFLIDKEIFENLEAEVFLPDVSIRQLFAFELLAKLTENSLVNLAISSGLLASALNIDTSESLAAPASGQGSFTFSFKPSPDATDIWEHYKGQVEIDALFVGKRQGKETLFVIEAKTSENFESLAKHKLVYPILALSTKVPKSIPIVPLYLRAINSPRKKYLEFYIAECSPIDREAEIVCVNQLRVTCARHFTLMGLGRNFQEDIAPPEPQG